MVAAQAFHWFDTHPALDEFRRILREPRRLALIWNDRLNDTAFLQAYEALLQSHGTDYQAVNHQAISDQELANLFVRDFEMQTFDNQQQLDLEGLKGRVFSSSYTPSPNDPGYNAMVLAIEDAFRRHQQDGHVTIRYQTKIYSGCIEVGGSPIQRGQRKCGPNMTHKGHILPVRASPLSKNSRDDGTQITFHPRQSKDGSVPASRCTLTSLRMSPGTPPQGA